MTTPVNDTAAALLGLLHDGPMTGGELVAAAQRRLGPFWNITRSQVYRELPALATTGHVKATKAGARATQPYSITASGRKAFSSWLGAAPGPDRLRNPLLLRVAFGGQHGTARLTALLKNARASHETALAEHREQLAVLRKDAADRHLIAATEFSVAYERALLKWLDGVSA